MYHYEQVPHTADITVKITADSLQQLFAGALEAMFAAMGLRYGDQKNRATRRDSVALNAPDTETLLVDFLSQALALSDVYNHAYQKVIFHSFAPHALEADLEGAPVAGFTTEIKAVTYHDLKVVHENNKFSATIVFDI